MSTRTEVVTPALLKQWELPRPGGSKHSRGKAVIVGGSRSTPGALILAGVAALRVGAGVLAIAAPDPVAIALAVALPEASVIGFDERRPYSDTDGLAELVDGADSVLLGPGLDDPGSTRQLLEGLFDRDIAGAGLVLDAYALGVLPTLDRALQHESLVLSPNPDEAARLLGVDVDRLDDDDATVAATIAARWRAVVCYQSMIADPDGRQWQVQAGHPGLGTSGSGDVLSGAIAGLLARGASPTQAAVWACYLHSAAGDRLAAHVGRLGFLARELLPELPAVLTEIQA